jgi:hypothetical protein
MDKETTLKRIEKAASVINEIGEAILEAAHRLEWEYRDIVPPRGDGVITCMRWEADVEQSFQQLHEISSILRKVPDEIMAIVNKART